MAALLFYDLSLFLPSSAADADKSSSARLPLAATARALELGYAAVALDYHHRGLLADSHRCLHTDPFPALSSLPLPPAAALHRRRLASPTSQPFRSYTRITLSLDSAAAAASALAPSAARLLRTYDIVAARPLTQAAFDYLCQFPHSQQLDLISIDFSRDLPFRLKLPMIKLALQRGLHFEVAYSPIISTNINARRSLLAEAKLLVDWTKGKNLIISSAAHTATEIRGPYDIINLFVYLLGLPMHRVKAAISTNCRSLISKALQKKHFYKETIRIDRLLPNEELNSEKLKLGDWIGWDSISCKGDLQSLPANRMELSTNKDERPSSPIYGVVQVLQENVDNIDVDVFAKLPEQSSDEETFPPQTQEVSVQVDRGEALINCCPPILRASLAHQSVVLDKPGNNENVLNFAMQAGSDGPVDLKSMDEHVEFVQDGMEVDATETCRLNLTMADNVPSTSDTSIMLACSVFTQDMESFGTSVEAEDLGQSCEIVDNYTKDECHMDHTSCEREKAALGHEILSSSNVSYVNKEADQSIGIPIHTEVYNGTSESVVCPPGGRDDQAPWNVAFHSSHSLCRDVVMKQHIMEGKTEQCMDENTQQTVVDEVESADIKLKELNSVEPVFHGQEISSTDYTYGKRPADASCKNDEVKEQNSEDTYTFLEKNIDKTNEQSYSYPNEKQRRKLRSHQPAYRPFLGILKSAHFKKKVRGLVKPM